MPILGGCLCFDLPTGTKIIGSLYLISAITSSLGLIGLNIILYGLGFASKILEMMEQAAQEAERDGNNMTFGGNNNDYVEPQFEVQQQKQIRVIVDIIKKHFYFVQIAMLVLMCFAILSIITSSMLIHGVRKRCRCLLLPWVAQEFLNIFVGLAMTIITFILLGTAQLAWTLAVPFIVYIFIEIFFILVVISQYQALELIRMQDEMCMK